MKQLFFKHFGKTFCTEYSTISKENEVCFTITFLSSIIGYFDMGDKIEFYYKTISNKNNFKKISYWSWASLPIRGHVSSNITCSIFCALQKQENFNTELVQI